MRVGQFQARRIGRASSATLVGVVVTGAVAFGGTTAGRAQTTGSDAPLGKTTLQQSIRGAIRGDGVFAGLSPAPGEPYIVREEALGIAGKGRERRRRSLASFAQLTDFQLSDEESPARVEFLDSSADELRRCVEAPGGAGGVHD